MVTWRSPNSLTCAWLQRLCNVEVGDGAGKAIDNVFCWWVVDEDVVEDVDEEDVDVDVDDNAGCLVGTTSRWEEEEEQGEEHPIRSDPNKNINSLVKAPNLNKCRHWSTPWFKQN